MKLNPSLSLYLPDPKQVVFFNQAFVVNYGKTWHLLWFLYSYSVEPVLGGQPVLSGHSPWLTA